MDEGRRHSLREGVLHVQAPHGLNDAVSDELRVMLSRLPLSVPVILELSDRELWPASDIGIVLSFAEVASSAGHSVGITAGEDLRIQLAGIGLDATVVMAASAEECERRLVGLSSAW